MNTESRTVTFNCEYGAPDVRACLRQYVQRYLYTVSPTVNLMGFGYSEDDIITILKVDMFGHLPEKYGRKFGKWAFKLAVEDKLIVESAVKPGTYYMSTALATKTGRPRNDAEES